MGTTRARVAVLLVAIFATVAVAVALFAQPQCLTGPCQVELHSQQQVCPTICLANPFVVYRLWLMAAVIVLCAVVLVWVFRAKKNQPAA